MKKKLQINIMLLTREWRKLYGNAKFVALVKKNLNINILEIKILSS